MESYPNTRNKSSVEKALKEENMHFLNGYISSLQESNERLQERNQKLRYRRPTVFDHITSLIELANNTVQAVSQSSFNTRLTVLAFTFLIVLLMYSNSNTLSSIQEQISINRHIITDSVHRLTQQLEQLSGTSPSANAGSTTTTGTSDSKPVYLQAWDRFTDI